MQDTKDNFSYKITEAKTRCDEDFQSYANFVETSCDELTAQCDKTIDKLTSLDKTIKKQSKLVDDFVNKDFQQDIPTGKV